MKIIAAASLCVLALACSHKPVSMPSNVIEITRPSVIGFVPPTTKADNDQMNDEAITKDDFLESWNGFAKWAQAAGIDTRTAEPRFVIRIAERNVRIHEKTSGYLLVDATGRKKVLHGVRTDGDLTSEVCRFFSSIPASACANAD
jgi:hypothetical protein